MFTLFVIFGVVCGGVGAFVALCVAVPRIVRRAEAAAVDAALDYVQDRHYARN